MTETPEIIYLIPFEDVYGVPSMVWCDDPAASYACDPAEAVEYIRADAFEQAQAEIKRLEQANFIKCDLAIEWKVKLDKAQARVAELENLIRYAQVESGVCMCGDEIENHNQASGHSPVDIWDHAAEKALEGASDAWLLRKQAEALERLMDGVGVHTHETITGEGISTDEIWDYATRLRQQADQLEKAGGEE